MKCPKCGNKNFEIINQVQQDGKSGDSITTALIVISIFGIIISFFGMRNAIQSAQSAREIITQSFDYICAAFFMRLSIILFFATLLVHAFLPYKTKNVIKVVCKDCGHAATLKAFKEATEVTPSPVPSDENKQE